MTKILFNFLFSFKISSLQTFTITTLNATHSFLTPFPPASITLFSLHQPPSRRPHKGEKEKNPPISFPYKKNDPPSNFPQSVGGVMALATIYIFLVPHTLSLSISQHAIKKAKGEKRKKQAKGLKKARKSERTPLRRWQIANVRRKGQRKE